MSKRADSAEAKSMADKPKLTRAERKQIEAVIRKYRGDGKPHTAQDTIPYQIMYPDGICYLGNRRYSQSIEFFDINYLLAQPDDQTAIFEYLCDLYNYLDSSIHVQFTYPNRKSDREQLARSFEMPPCNDGLDPIRQEQTDILKLSNTKNARYHCRTLHLETEFNCTSEGILQADVHEMVVTLIRTYAAYAVSLEHLLVLQKERIQTEKKQARRELAVLQSRKNQFEKALQDLYEKLIDGTIDKETYLSHKASNQAKMQELSDQMKRLEKNTQTTTGQGGAFIEKYKEYAELETLTSEIANDVVKRVTVHKDGGIEIELALRDELEKLLTCLETVDAAS